MWGTAEGGSSMHLQVQQMFGELGILKFLTLLRSPFSKTYVIFCSKRKKSPGPILVRAKMFT